MVSKNIYNTKRVLTVLLKIDKNWKDADNSTIGLDKYQLASVKTKRDHYRSKKIKMLIQKNISY